MNLFAIKKNVRLYRKFVLKCHSDSVHDKVTRIYDIYMDEVKIIQAHLFFPGLVLFWREKRVILSLFLFIRIVQGMAYYNHTLTNSCSLMIML